MRSPKYLRKVFRRHHAEFECACGVVFVSYIYNVQSGHTKSCGCLLQRKGITKKPEYKIWQNMRSRCNNPKATGFHRYGGRGIAVCPEWESFEKFLGDVGPRPSINHTLDRIDVNGHYCPQNCRWATRSQQANNVRDNHVLTVGSKSQTVSEWAQEIGLKPNTLLYRIRRGWSVSRALTQSRQ